MGDAPDARDAHDAHDAYDAHDAHDAYDAHDSHGYLLVKEVLQTSRDVGALQVEHVKACSSWR